MNRIRAFLIGMMVLTAPLIGSAQVKNEGLANQIIAARQKNAALMKQYNWFCRTEFLIDGSVKDTRIDSVTYGPDGNLQKTVINDQHSNLPRGFLRRDIAENQRKEMEQYLNGLHRLLEQYTLATPGAMINFISTANIQTGQAPDGTPTLTMTGNNVINPGDTLTVTVNPTNFQPLNAQITCFYNGQAVTISGSFKTIPSGLTHLQFATVLVPAKTILLQVQNYDYSPNN